METEEDTASTSETELGKLNESDYKNYINTKYNGLITVLSDDSELVVTTRPLILALHNFNKLGTQLEPWCDQIVEAAEAYESRVDFAVADFKSLTIGPKYNKFNYELFGSKSQPRFFAFDLHGNQYRKDEFLKRQTLKEFALLLLKEQLLISEPLLQDDLDSRVKIAVGKNLRELLKNCNKDIFIVFYINKNENSEELIAKLEELARLLQHEDLAIIKINAAENHIPLDFNIVRYPRCFYIRKNDKNRYIQYEQEKYAIENLIEFIAEHSTAELECCDRYGMLKEELRFETELHLDSITDIRSMVKNNYSDLIQVITKIEVTEKPLIVAFHDFMRFYDHLEPWCDIIGEIARKFEGQVNFAIADVNLFCIGGHEFERASFTVNSRPWIFAFDKEHKQYRLKKWLSSSTLENFIVALQRNELKQSDFKEVYAIEPLVKVGTRDNFDELVLNNSKDVFILFYTPSTYFDLQRQEYVASLLKDDENQVIAKVNTKEKPYPYQKINASPTYIYVTGHVTKNARCWNSVKGLIKFIAANSRYELKYYDREGYLRREYKRKCLIRPLQHISTITKDEDENANEEETPCTGKNKLGNIITTSAFEGLLALRTTDKENYEIVEKCAQVDLCGNFNDFVFKTNKDIFLVFYSCLSHKIRIVLNELVKLLSYNDGGNIIIATMNTQWHSVPSRYKKIRYQHCIFVPKNNKKNFIELSTQSHTLESYIQFIAAHSSIELTNYDRKGVLKEKVSKSECDESIFHLIDAYDESLPTFEYSCYKQDIVNFINKSKYNGLLSLICPDEGENIKMFKTPLMVIVHDFKIFKEKILLEYSATLLPVLKNFQDKIKCYLCDCEYFKRFQPTGCEFSSVHNIPEIYSIDSSNHMYGWPYENFMQFTSKTLNNELFKCEPLPQADHDDALVKKAVVHNFEQLVFNDESDVFLYIYYSEWYEDKEAAAEILQPIAELFEDEEIAFVQIDGSKNYIPLEFTHGGYFFSKTRTKAPLRYYNCSSLKSFIAFLSANATNELKSYNRKGIPKKRLKAD